MTSNNIKFLKYATAVLFAVVFVAATFSSNNIKFDTNLLRGRATDTVNGSITFSKPSSTTTYIPNNYYYTSGKTTMGMTVYLRNVCTTSFGNSYVAVMPGSTESPSLDPEITFSLSNSAVSVPQFGFQNIASIYAKSDSEITRTLYVYTSNDGSSWSSAISFGIDSSGATCTNVSGAKYIKIGYQGFYTLNIVEFIINYTCSSVEPEPSKTVESIEVKTAPTKIEYTEGDTFDPLGLVITATYDDSSTSDVAYSGNESDFSFSPSSNLKTTDNSVTITYGGQSCTQNISVAPGLSGKYTNNYIYGTLTIDFDKLQYTYGSYVTRFTYSLSGSSITFTYVIDGSSDTDNSRARLFKVGETTNTGTLSGNKISIKTYNSSGTGTTREFSK